MDILLGSLLIQALNAIQYGLLLFLIASGLTLIFGVMGVINIAHGSFYMMGAYFAFTITGLTGNFFVAVILGAILSVIIGALLEWALFKHLYKRDHLEQVLLSYGLILIFEELRSIFVGDEVHSIDVPAWLNFSIPLGDIMSYPFYRLFMSGVSRVFSRGRACRVCGHDQRAGLGGCARDGHGSVDCEFCRGCDWGNRFCLGCLVCGYGHCICRHFWQRVFPECSGDADLHNYGHGFIVAT